MKRTPLILAVVILAASVALGIGLDRANRSDQPSWPKLSRAGSKKVGGSGGRALPFHAVPDRYDIIYRVELPGGNRIVVTTDRITVRRPFDSRVQSLSGPPPGVTLAGDRASRFATLALGSTDGSTAKVFAPPPGLAGSDLRPDAVLPEAVRKGTVEVRERRRVLGRDCQVYRTGTTIQDGRLVPAGTTAHEYADICVDRSGLLLEEVWVKDGHWIRRRVAAGLREPKRLDDSDFTLSDEEEVAFAGGNGFVKEVQPDTLPQGPGWSLDQPPAGFTLKGRFAVTPPDTRAFQQPLDEPKRVAVEVSDVWVRGSDVLVMEQGVATSERGVFTASSFSEDVDLGAIGRGEALLDFRGNEARTLFNSGRYVRLVGTMPLADMIKLARSLRPVQGTGVVFL